MAFSRFHALAGRLRHPYTRRGSLDRGQVGISALVLFIALLLIATTTAGIFLQTTGLLEARSSQVNADVDNQMTDRVSLIAASGVDTGTKDATVNEIRLIVTQDSPSGQIDLGEATLQVRHPNNTATLTYAGTSPPEQESTFSVEPIQDAQDTVPVLTDSTDRFAIIIKTTSLEQNTSITIQLTLQSGTSHTFRFMVPPAIAHDQTVRFR